MRTVEEENQRSINSAKSEILQRRGRNIYLRENIPRLEENLRRMMVQVERDRSNAQAKQAKAEKRLDLTLRSIDRNEYVASELESLISWLEDSATSLSDDSVEVREGKQKFTRTQISLYTGPNGVVKNSEINYGYLLNL